MLGRRELAAAAIAAAALGTAGCDVTATGGVSQGGGGADGGSATTTGAAGAGGSAPLPGDGFAHGCYIGYSITEGPGSVDWEICGPFGGAAQASVLAALPSGNAVVANTGTPKDTNLALLEIDPEGELVGSTTVMTFAAHTANHIEAIRAGASGVVYLAGEYEDATLADGSPLVGAGVFLVEVDSSGAIARSRAFPHSCSAFLLEGLALDATEAPYLAGHCSGGSIDLGGTTVGDGGGQTPDLVEFVARFDADANVVWAQGFLGQFAGGRGMLAVAPDGTAAVLAVGNDSSTTATVIRRFGADGQPGAVQALGDVEFEASAAPTLAAGASGDVFFSATLSHASFCAGCPDQTLFIGSALPDGSVGWYEKVVATSRPSVGDLTTDSEGALYVSATGNVEGAMFRPPEGPFSVTMAAKFQPSGALVWSADLNQTPGLMANAPSQIAVSTAGRVYVTGPVESKRFDQVADTFLARLKE